MSRLHRIAAPLALALVLALVGGLGLRVALSRADAKHYVCPPCGAPCDSKVFDHPGICPECGMTLVEQGAAAAPAASAPSPGKVGVLLFNGAEIIDYTGPWEIFGAAGFNVYSIAATKDPITTAMGMSVVPKYTFADAPQPDILVVPGGGVRGASNDAATLEWLRKCSAGTRHTLSVCNGAFILASAGLLDGLSATTTAGNLDRLKDGYPKVHVVYDKRYVDNGKIITAGGLTAGIDGALHVVERVLGRGTAEQVALSEEHEWQPEGGFARAMLADQVIPQLRDKDLTATGEWNVLSTQGTRDHWDISLEGPSNLTPTEMSAKLADTLTTRGKWVAVHSAAAASAGPVTSQWRITGRDGSPWNGTLTVAAKPGDGKDLQVTIHVARASGSVAREQ